MRVRKGRRTKTMTWENENTYNSSCPDFDTYDGRCKYGIACRKENCPKEDGWIYLNYIGGGRTTQ